jgi:TolA-binding protein
VSRLYPIIALMTILCFSTSLRAQGEDDKDKSIADLKQQVAALEKRLAAIEKLTAPLEARQAFDDRMTHDQQKYSSEQLREAETLYQTMNKLWRSSEGKSALQSLVAKYPDINRTGCAFLYLGQVTDGDEQVKNLQTAIEKYSDCMYGDGVRVGAYARFLLAQHFKQSGNADGATHLFDEIKKDYPTSIDHHGRRLVDQIDAK